MANEGIDMQPLLGSGRFKFVEVLLLQGGEVLGSFAIDELDSASRPDFSALSN